MNLILPNMPLEIVRDSHEKKPWFTESEFHNKVTTLSRILAFGDYGRGGREVERKTIVDLGRCLSSGRWDKTYGKVVDGVAYLGRENFLFVIEGSPEDFRQLRGDWKPKPTVLRRRLAQLQRACNVVWAGDRHTAEVVALEFLSINVVNAA